MDNCLVQGHLTHGWEPTCHVPIRGKPLYLSFHSRPFGDRWIKGKMCLSFLCLTYFTLTYTLACCWSVRYDMSPVEKNVLKHFHSMGSPCGLRLWYFLQALCMPHTGRQPVSTRKCSYDLDQRQTFMCLKSIKLGWLSVLSRVPWNVNINLCFWFMLKKNKKKHYSRICPQGIVVHWMRRTPCFPDILHFCWCVPVGADTLNIYWYGIAPCKLAARKHFLLWSLSLVFSAVTLGLIHTLHGLASVFCLCSGTKQTTSFWLLFFLPWKCISPRVASVSPSKALSPT